MWLQQPCQVHLEAGPGLQGFRRVAGGYCEAAAAAAAAAAARGVRACECACVCVCVCAFPGGLSSLVIRAWGPTWPQ